MTRQDSFNKTMALLACLVMSSGAGAFAAEHSTASTPVLIAETTADKNADTATNKEAEKAEQKAEEKAEKIADKEAKVADKEAKKEAKEAENRSETSAAEKKVETDAAATEAGKAATEVVNKAHGGKAATVESKSAKPDVKTVSGAIKKDGKAPKQVLAPAVKKQQQTDQKMVDAVNTVDGVKVDKDVFKAEKKGFKLGDLNPIKWIFKPITDMQKQVVHLEKQIMRLEAPIASLQKPMVGLREDMGGVQKQMGSLRTDIGGIHDQMSGVDARLARVETQLNKIYRPVSELKEPVLGLQKPVAGVNSELQTLKKDLKDLKDVVGLTSTLILVAVIGVGLLIVVGTPVAAMFAWRHRATIMKKLGEEPSGKGDPLEESPKEKREAVTGRR